MFSWLRGNKSIVSAAALSLFFQAAASQEGKTHLKIGLAIPQPRVTTTNLPSMTPILERASQMALKDLRPSLEQAGLSLEISVDFIDESPESILPAVEKHVTSDFIATVGFAPSRFAAIAGPKLKGTDLLVISPNSTATELTQFSENLLLPFDTTEKSSKVLEAYIKSTFPSKKILAFVTWDDPFPKSVFNAFSDEFRSEVVLEKVLNDKVDPKAVHAAVLKHRPDVLLIPNFPSTSAAIIKAAKESGFQGIYLGGGSWGENVGGSFHTLTKDLGIRATELRQISGLSARKEHVEFERRLVRNGETYTVTAATYYDAMTYLAQRLIECGRGCTRAKLKKEILRSPASASGLLGRGCYVKSECDSTIQASYSVIEMDRTGFQFVGWFPKK